MGNEKKILVFTYNDVQRFREFNDPQEVRRILVSEGINIPQEIQSCFYYYNSLGYFGRNIFANIHRKNIQVGLDISENSEEDELRGMMKTYLDLNGPHGTHWGFRSPYVVLTQSNKLPLLRKVCNQLEIEVTEVESPVSA